MTSDVAFDSPPRRIAGLLNWHNYIQTRLSSAVTSGAETGLKFPASNADNPVHFPAIPPILALSSPFVRHKLAKLAQSIDEIIIHIFVIAKYVISSKFREHLPERREFLGLQIKSAVSEK